MKRRYARVWLPVALSTVAAVVVFALLAFIPWEADFEVAAESFLPPSDSLSANGEAADGRSEEGETYEVLRLDLGAVDRGGPAPCDGCLDETGAIELGWEYLRDKGIKRPFGELRAELMEDFPWRGADGLRYRQIVRTLSWEEMVAAQKVWPDPDIEYDGEGSGSGAGEYEPGENLTWRVWYVLNRTTVEEIEEMVDSGMLALEALSWPPQKEEGFLLVHAKTRSVIAPHMNPRYAS